MTALADIAKAGDILRGSDLLAFNESHPRDTGGRFTTVTGSPLSSDPRVQRAARAKRNKRRRVRGAAADLAASVAAATTLKPAEEEKKAVGDPRILSTLRRERIRVPRMAAKAPAQRGEEADINDKSFLSEPLGDHKASDQYVVVTREQALQFIKEGSLVVGAARKAWQHEMMAGTQESARGLLQQNVRHVSGEGLAQDYVALRLRRSFFADDEPVGGYGDLQVSGAQIFEPMGTPWRTNDPVERMESLFDKEAIHLNEIEAVNVISVNVHTKADYKTNMRGSKAAIMKAATEDFWDEDEHPRDFNTGRFVSTRIGRATPPGAHGDPRAARVRRRRRRQMRGLVGFAAPAGAPADLRSGEVGHERLATQRLATQRIPVRRNERIQVKAAAQRLIPDLPEDATVTFTADKGDDLKTVEGRQKHYEENGVYPGIRDALSVADKLIQGAAAGTLSDEDVVLFSRKFLSGQRTAARYAEPLTEQDISQAVRQLAGSIRMFRHMQAQGAGQWQVEVEPGIEEEKKEATHIAVQPGTMADLLGFSTPIDYGETGYGTKTIPIARYREAVQIHEDRVAASQMHRELDSIRRNDPNRYKKVSTTNMLRYTSGMASYNEALEEVAISMGNEAAARHYRREEARAIALAQATVKTKIAGKQRAAERRAKNEMRAFAHDADILEDVAEDIRILEARREREQALKEEIQETGEFKDVRPDTYSRIKGKDATAADIEAEAIHDPRIRTRPKKLTAAQVAEREEQMREYGFTF